ncbi:hypothetical protein DRO31_02945 [Candidatus Bathyarchaeota archaeon]|nr:MAG: hypothetical protein DRO31_02945 [Candidatus Bathyarchaeota archaeon]
MRLTRDRKGRLGFWITTKEKKRVFLPLSTVLKRLAVVTSAVVSAHVAAYLLFKRYLRRLDYKRELQALSKIFKSWRELKPRFTKAEAVLPKGVARRLKPSCLQDVRFLRVSDMSRVLKALGVDKESVYPIEGMYLPRTRVILFEDPRAAAHELGHHIFFHVLNPSQRRKVELIAKQIVETGPFQGDRRVVHLLREYLEDPNEVFAFAFEEWAAGGAPSLYRKNALKPLIDWIEKNLVV